MNTRNLETFYWISRLGSFTKAAEHVYATQSTVSMRIRELEDSLGVRLFDRTHRSVRLTPKGRELASYAERLLELTNEMRQRIQPSDAVRGVIRIGVVELIACTWLPRLITTLRERYPEVRLEFEVALTVTLVDKLQNGALDAIFALGQSPSGDYASESLGRIQLDWMANPALGIPKRRVAPKELDQMPFITLNHFSYHYANVQRWMKKNQVRGQKVIVCDSIMLAAALVVAGVGIGLLPPVCYRAEIRQGRLQVVRTADRMCPVETTATYPVGGFQPLAPLVTRLATEVSDFDT